jgi:sulfoxide reductase heme-binding subunit YedZ
MTIHSRAARFFNAAYFFWALLASPAGFLLYGYAQGSLFYGEVLHASGETGARLLIAAMAITPLRLMFPAAAPVRWLMHRRRHLGVAAFGYSLLHAAVYVERQGELAAIVEDALAIAMWTGWLALLVMLVLAATSNDVSVRAMRRGWRWLHRAVYGAALLTFTHWVLSAFDPVPGAIHLGILGALEGYRVWHIYSSPRRARAPSAPAD